NDDLRVKLARFCTPCCGLFSVAQTVEAGSSGPERVSETSSVNGPEPISLPLLVHRLLVPGARLVILAGLGEAVADLVQARPQVLVVHPAVDVPVSFFLGRLLEPGARLVILAGLGEAIADLVQARPQALVVHPAVDVPV